MKQKLGIALAFMHNPEVLILDEPTSGLDPLMQRLFNDLIMNEKEKGKTILMSSHSFEEIEKTCSRVGFIKEGKLAAMSHTRNLTLTLHSRHSQGHKRRSPSTLAHPSIRLRPTHPPASLASQGEAGSASQDQQAAVRSFDIFDVVGKYWEALEESGGRMVCEIERG